MIVLHKRFVDPSRGQLIGAISFHEEPARVLEDARLDKQHTWQGRFDDFQRTSMMADGESAP